MTFSGVALSSGINFIMLNAISRRFYLSLPVISGNCPYFIANISPKLLYPQRLNSTMPAAK